MAELAETILILANVMSGEAMILNSDDAMIAVGHVFLNRLLHVGARFGNTAIEVTRGFSAFGPDRKPNAHTMELARQVITNRMVLGTLADTTQGCLFMLSYQDILRLYDEPACIYATADWQSEWRKIDDDMYRLYGFKTWPMPSNESPLCDPKYDKAFTGLIDEITMHPDSIIHMEETNG